MKFRPKTNLIIDALMLLCICAIAGIGFLLKHTLPPGRERMEQYGRNVQLTFLGMDRHDWGHIHLIVGLVFLGLLVLHIVLHAGMIEGIFRCSMPGRWRFAVYAVLAVLSLGLLLFAFAVKPEIDESGGGHGGVIRAHAAEGGPASQGGGRGYRGGRGGGIP